MTNDKRYTNDWTPTDEGAAAARRDSALAARAPSGSCYCDSLASGRCDFCTGLRKPAASGDDDGCPYCDDGCIECCGPDPEDFE
jgi:hypothetical protein